MPQIRVLFCAGPGRLEERRSTTGNYEEGTARRHTISHMFSLSRARPVFIGERRNTAENCEARKAEESREEQRIAKESKGEPTKSKKSIGEQ